MYLQVFEWEKQIVQIFNETSQKFYFLGFMEFVSDFSKTWPIIVFAVLISFIRYDVRLVLKRLVLMLFAVGSTDFICRYIIKELFQRPRPNFINEICDSSKCWGFVSNHSANIAVVAFMLIAFKKKNTYWAIPIMLLVGSSRIFLRSHFPLDVLGGYFVGLLIAIIVLTLSKKVNCHKSQDISI